MTEPQAKARKAAWWSTPAVLIGAAGGLLLGIAAVIGGHRYGPGGRLSLSQANGLCSSAFGQLAQATYARAGANCSSIAGAEQARGWLAVAGAAVLAAGCVWAVRCWLRERQAA